MFIQKIHFMLKGLTTPVSFIYQKKMFTIKIPHKMRMNRSILSWNEHVDRPFTSRTHHQQAHYNKRNLGKKRIQKENLLFCY
jgi:hypothetical protein